MQGAPPTIAVLGHVEHITLGFAPALPGPGEIVHLTDGCVIPGGGGGVTFFQLTRSHATLHLYTALGDDGAAAEMERRLRGTRAHLHIARRHEPHTRDIVLLTPDGERTIIVLGSPLQPRRSDDLPWHELDTCDAAYFTATDPDLLREARRARLLMVSARRREALNRSGVRADIVVGSRLDPREVSTLADYAAPPTALVLTEGPLGGSIETAAGSERFVAPPPPPVRRSSYGAGDSFAGALLWFVVKGCTLPDACRRAGPYGAAVLASHDTVSAQAWLPDTIGERRPAPSGGAVSGG